MIKFFCDKCYEEVPAGDVCQLTMDVKDDETVKRKTYGLCKRCRNGIKDIIEKNSTIIDNKTLNKLKWTEHQYELIQQGRFNENAQIISIERKNES